LDKAAAVTLLGVLLKDATEPAPVDLEARS
jgi:hypothetical protein